MVDGDGVPVIVTGDGWTMYRGDCLEIMPSIERADVIITDPPYEKEAHKKARRSLKDATQKRGAVNTGETRRIDAPLEISFPAISDTDRKNAAQLFADSSRRWVVAFCQIEAVAAWRHAYEVAGLQWVRGGVWRKRNGAPQFTGDRPGQGFECLSIGHPPGRKRWNGGGRHGVWDVPLDHRAGGRGQNCHPTRKPTALMMALVEDFSDPVETVIDPFAGSGTTGIACIRLGRNFVGIEREPKYFDLAVERLREAELQGATHIKSYLL